MGLLLTEVGLTDFRNIHDLTLELSPEITILVGHNATGKTNTIEALQLLTTGVSFRHPSPHDLMLDGCETARIVAQIQGDGRVVDIQCDINHKSRKFSRNGKHCQPREVAGTLLSILFTPDDLSFVKGSASNRRSELDMFAAQVNKGYSRVLSSYTRGIEQRNKLLKEDFSDPSLLDAWDESVALGAATVLQARVKLFSRMCTHITHAYQQISDGEELSCEYVCTLGINPEGMDKENLVEVIRDTLVAGRAEDLRRQQTCIGPHRDDIHFKINNKDARTFGSQGQQRSITLAWKMAEVLVAAEITGNQPLLLLDDVMSELDEQRREAMTNFVSSGIQTVVTTTNLGYFSEELLKSAKVVRFGE